MSPFPIRLIHYIRHDWVTKWSMCLSASSTAFSEALAGEKSTGEEASRKLLQKVVPERYLGS